MHYIEYIRKSPKQDDPILEQNRIRFSNDKNFPITSDIKELSEYLWDKLDDQEVTKYQVSLLVWFLQLGKTQPNNDDINDIIDLRNERNGKQTIPEAKAPGDVVALFPADMSQEDDESLMMFVAVDIYSNFLFKPHTAEDNKPETLLLAIQDLMDNEDFKTHSQPFTLVLHKFEELRSEIEQIIKPHGGTFMVSDSYVHEHITPVMEELFKSMAERMNSK